MGALSAQNASGTEEGFEAAWENAKQISHKPDDGASEWDFRGMLKIKHESEKDQRLSLIHI